MLTRLLKLFKIRPKMGQSTPVKTDRNEQLKADYLNGMNVRDLIIKYDISAPRIYAILKYVGVKPNKIKRKGGK